MTGPWTFSEAVGKSRDASRKQEDAEEFIKDASKQAALAEEAYRLALSTKIVELRANATPATVAADIARGDPHVARLRRERDIKEGVREAANQAAWRRAADRRDVARFADWSARREIAEGYRDPEVPDGPIIGARHG